MVTFADISMCGGDIFKTHLSINGQRKGVEIDIKIKTTDTLAG